MRNRILWSSLRSWRFRRGGMYSLEALIWMMEASSSHRLPYRMLHRQIVQKSGEQEAWCANGSRTQTFQISEKIIRFSMIFWTILYRTGKCTVTEITDQNKAIFDINRNLRYGLSWHEKRSGSLHRNDILIERKGSFASSGTERILVWHFLLCSYISIKSVTLVRAVFLLLLLAG